MDNIKGEMLGEEEYEVCDDVDDVGDVTADIELKLVICVCTTQSTTSSLQTTRYTEVRQRDRQTET